jgi:hypothetical protein
MGLLPGGDGGTFLQRVPLEERRLWTTTRAERGGRPVSLSSGAVTPLPMDALPPTSRRSGSGRVVYYGFLADNDVPADRRLTPEQIAGSVVVMRAVPAPGAQPWSSPLPPIFDFPHTGRPRSPVVAVLLVAEGNLAAQLDHRRDLSARGRIVAPSRMPAADLPPVFLVTPEAAEALLGRPLAAMRYPEAGFGSTFGYTLHESARAVDAHNVVAKLPGSGGVEGGTWVVAGAHYDHLGTGAPVRGDSVYNGADDNASGVTALLEAARCLARTPPERRPSRGLLFTWFTAEESGLLGSAAFLAHPTVPRDSIAAFVNLDMVARNGRDSLRVLGPRRLSADLREAVDAANARLTRPFVLDDAQDASDDPVRSFCRSDHIHFARAGIPVAFLTSGLHADYHRPWDEAGTLDYDKLASVTSLTVELLREIAARPSRPALLPGIRVRELCR